MARQAFRKEKLEKEIVREASRIILYELKDPRLGFVTIMRAKVSKDFRYAKVYISVLGDDKKKRLTMRGLEHAKGFVQRELSSAIRLRNFPEIRFELDESTEKTFEVIRIIDEATRGRDGNAPSEEE